ncbi:facilitated trehalose transporter Tret1-like [Culicoides brevitarsis]|uniref:facilitated trehalose transporter Tret1-like n=1 Tax=Culicoides brevitarsis TaxID=469753 RepID=UPI00307B3692
MDYKQEDSEKGVYHKLSLMESEYFKKQPNVKPISAFRRILPQVFASAAQNLLILDLAMAMNFPTIAIPALRGIRNRDIDEVITFTETHASWFASMAFICQPIGSILSGVIVEKLGRKRAMIVVNLPHIAAWLMLYFAQSIEMVFVANLLLGLGVGFMEAPVITYVGEISEPSIRGILISMAQIGYALGCFILYLIGASTNWRNTALLCCIVPVFTMFAVSLVPETPLWLLSKGRKAEAQKSLQWLRGWVPKENVAQEFHDIQRYNEDSHRCVACQKTEQKCNHPKPSLGQRWKELFRKNTMKPFFIIFSCFFFSCFTTATSMRPYYIQIFEKYQIEPNQMTVWIGVVGVLANLGCAAGVKLFGKRTTTIVSMGGITVLSIGLAIHTWKELPRGLTSFDKLPSDQEFGGSASIIAMALFLGLAFCTNVGIISVPWIMVSEIYPNKTRGLASGLTAALNYTMFFISIKTYYDLETSISLFGAICLYGAIGFLGTIFIYIFLPETEGKTLEEIEEHFSDSKKKLSDRKIVSQKLLN